MNSPLVSAIKMSEDGYEGSVRDLFDDSTVEDGVPDNIAASGASNSVSVGLITPVK